MAKKKESKLRTFEGGGIRDTGEGKLLYYGSRHPLTEQSFTKYMEEHRRLPDGSMRGVSNWWCTWDKEISLQSMVRHLEDLQAIHAGYIVFELRYDRKVVKEYLDGGIEKANDKVKEWKESKIDFKWITAEECLSAIRFNSDAYKLRLLKENI